MALLNAENVAEYLQRYSNSSRQAIQGTDLVKAICGYYSIGLHRSLSDVIEDLRLRGFPVASGSNGYWWANDSESFGNTIKLLYKRAMTALKQITKMRRVAMPDLVGQLRIPVGSEPSFEGLYQGFRRLETPRVSLVVDLPEELHQGIRSFLDSNKSWDQERLYVAALSLFLLQQGVQDRAAVECFLAAGGDDEP